MEKTGPPALVLALARALVTALLVAPSAAPAPSLAFRRYDVADGLGNSRVNLAPRTGFAWRD